jgi:hypothetical protein
MKELCPSLDVQGIDLISGTTHLYAAFLEKNFQVAMGISTNFLTSLVLLRLNPADRAAARQVR